MTRPLKFRTSCFLRFVDSCNGSRDFVGYGRTNERTDGHFKAAQNRGHYQLYRDRVNLCAFELGSLKWLPFENRLRYRNFMHTVSKRRLSSFRSCRWSKTNKVLKMTNVKWRKTIGSESSFSSLRGLLQRKLHESLDALSEQYWKLNSSYRAESFWLYLFRSLELGHPLLNFNIQDLFRTVFPCSCPCIWVTQYG